VSDREASDAAALGRRRWPWGRIDQFWLYGTGPGRYRLQIARKTRILKSYAVDAEIKCTKEQADQVRSLIGAWIDDQTRSAKRTV